jgi:hypothetical protein
MERWKLADIANSNIKEDGMFDNASCFLFHHLQKASELPSLLKVINSA